MAHDEHHYSQRAGWLRAAVLGANDGILSVSGLLMGVAAAAADTSTLFLTGVAGTLAGAISMAAGEYVSVRTQTDIEDADLDIERKALSETPNAERAELAEIYRKRGLDDDLADQVARQLMAHDALGSHARDELGISDLTRAKPLQAAMASAASFVFGAIVPISAALIAPKGYILAVISIATLSALASLGAVSARLSGASMLKSVLRIVFWGVAAMSVTSLIGSLFGAA